MTDTTPKLVAINTLLSKVKKKIAIIENNTTLETNSRNTILSLKQIQQPTLKQKQTLYAELYKIHKLKLNTYNSIDNIKKLHNTFEQTFPITGGSIDEEFMSNEEQRKQSMKNFLTYKNYIELEQKKFNI
tara:strand:+ start:169 stop:558 length:390 start_codon:yes stop_codon:yes gene_type:complete